jgi:cation transport regulator ChaC
MSEMVFAYGSNMCSGRFRAYGLEPIGHGRAALLDGYRLDFSKLSKDGSGKATVSPCSGHQVWGVLYEIHEADLACLDKGEGTGYTRSMRGSTLQRNPSPRANCAPILGISGSS